VNSYNENGHNENNHNENGDDEDDYYEDDYHKDGDDHGDNNRVSEDGEGHMALLEMHDMSDSEKDRGRNRGGVSRSTL